MKSRTTMRLRRFYKMTFIFLLGFPCLSVAETTEATVSDTTVCDPKCGCDGMYIYDEEKQSCVVDLPKLMKRVVVHYKNQSDEDILSQPGMARAIYIEGQKLFQGIMISVMIFIACASLCILSACIYCCRINYSDRKLRREVEALAKKMHKTNMLKETKKRTDDPKAQSCNVIVEEAGVFVV